jgi:two-component system LytT family response regulator
MPMLRALLVDDELHAVKSLEILLKECTPQVEVVGIARSASEALAMASTLNPNLVFLDIEMPPETGFDFLAQCKEVEFEVIFVTAYNHYAVKAFKHSAIDYIMKPVDLDDLKAAVKKASESIKIAQSSKMRYSILFDNLREVIPRKLVFRTSEGYRYFDVNDIISIHIDGNVLSILSVIKTTETIIVKDKAVLSSLDEKGFLNLGSTLVNLAKVSRIDKAEGGRAVMSNESVIHLNGFPRDVFIQKLEEFNNVSFTKK